MGNKWSPGCGCRGGGCSEWGSCARPASFEIAGADETVTNTLGRNCSSLVINTSHSFIWADCEHFVAHGGCAYPPSIESIYWISAAQLYTTGTHYVIDFDLSYVSVGGGTFETTFSYRYSHPIGTCPSGTIALTLIGTSYSGAFSPEPATPTSVEVTI